MFLLASCLLLRFIVPTRTEPLAPRTLVLCGYISAPPPSAALRIATSFMGIVPSHIIIQPSGPPNTQSPTHSHSHPRPRLSEHILTPGSESQYQYIPPLLTLYPSTFITSSAHPCTPRSLVPSSPHRLVPYTPITSFSRLIIFLSPRLNPLVLQLRNPLT